MMPGFFKRNAAWMTLALMLGMFVAGCRRVPVGGPVEVVSPNRMARIAFEARPDGQCVYSVDFAGTQIVQPSRMGLKLAPPHAPLGPMRLAGVRERAHDETYSVPAWKSSKARDHYRETTLSLREAASPNRALEIVLRAYDDGVAFRYRIPARAEGSEVALAGEWTEFNISDNPRAIALPLSGFTSPYERFYKDAALSELPGDKLIGLPLLLQYPTGVCAAITEAALTDYAGMYLAPSPDRPGSLVSRLSPLPAEPAVAVRAAAPFDSPWRVILLGDGMAPLIESNLILNLNEPSKISDTSWIKPGKVNFPWWNGYVVKDRDFKGALDTATLKYTIDFCAESGIEFASLDGLHGAWYGGPIRPDHPVDVTKSIPEIDLPEVLGYAARKGVRVRAWVHWEALAPQIDRAFAAYEAMGIEGVMVDFMDRDDQEMVRFYEEIARKAANHRLTVNFHGAFKPTGMERTWPNVLTREAVLNLEYDKFDQSKCTPRHNVTVPFVRMLAGPLDYHTGGFNSSTLAAFVPRFEAPMVIGTRCHHLAMYVVYQNPLPMAADHPAAYRGQPGLEFLAEVPTVWDETRFVAGSVGEFVVIARRRGETWYLGAMNNEDPRTVDADLGFLAAGNYAATIWADAPEANEQPAKVSRLAKSANRNDIIPIRMASGGGQVIRFDRAGMR